MKLRKEHEVKTDDDRVKLIADLVEEGSQDPFIRELSLNILRSNNIPEKESKAEIKAIFGWIKKNIVFRGDVFCRDSYHTAKRVVELGAGDCFPLNQKIIVKNKETGEYELTELGDLRYSFNKYEALSYNFDKKEWQFKNITNFIDKGNRQVVEVGLSNGSMFEVTPDHRFFTLEGQKEENYIVCERKLSDIDLTRSWENSLLSAYKIPPLDIAKIYGKYLTEKYLSRTKARVLVPNGNEYTETGIACKESDLDGLRSVDIRYIVPSFNKEVCDITVEDNHNFVLSNGLLAHNCDDYTILTGSMLASVGYPVGCRIMSSSPDSAYHHIYTLVGYRDRGSPLATGYRGLKWMALDGTIKHFEAGDEPKWAKKKDYVFVCGA